MKLRANVAGRVGKTEHLVADETSGRPSIKRPLAAHWIEIVQDASGVFLYRYDISNQCIADTWHQSINEAKAQAEFEFGVQASDWQEI